MKSLLPWPHNASNQIRLTDKARPKALTRSTSFLPGSGVLSAPVQPDLRNNLKHMVNWIRFNKNHRFLGRSRLSWKCHRMEAFFPQTQSNLWLNSKVRWTTLCTRTKRIADQTYWESSPPLLSLKKGSNQSWNSTSIKIWFFDFIFVKTTCIYLNK